MTDAVWLNANIATMLPGSPYGVINDGALAVRGERIVWTGPRPDIPAELRAHGNEVDAGGRWITPGLIDCHTHIVYAGNRAQEFEQRLNGATYEDIARQGGGIASTVGATRAADAHTLARVSETRLRALLSEGVTTIEI